MVKALLTDGLLSAFPAADACSADLCVVGKLLTVPALCLPVSAEEVSAAPVQKQGVVVQNVLHLDAVKGGELVRKFRRKAAAFGDGENDLGMLKSVTHGYAMGNAFDSVLEQISLHAPGTRRMAWQEQSVNCAAAQTSCRNGEGIVIHCDPNTSLYFRNVRLPAIRYQIFKGHSTADIRV